jgi:hypothetical protein
MVPSPSESPGRNSFQNTSRFEHGTSDVFEEFCIIQNKKLSKQFEI